VSGWLIRISEWDKPESIPDKPEPVRLFAAAESDPRAALVAVQNVTNAAPKLRVETIGQLSPQSLRTLGLEPGQVLDLTS
jgi:hypothetical protein